MKEFFLKHAQNFEPADAIDLLYHKVGNIKELVVKGDQSHLNELKELSNMIDDYVRSAQGHKFEPKEYKEYPSHKSPYGESQPQSRAPYKDDRRIGYHHPYIYPYFDRYGEYDDRQGK